jgi:hypothetical protein
MNHSPGEIPLWNNQHTVRGLIGHQHAAIRVCRDDGCRAAFDQNPQLLFGVASRVPLMLDFMKMLQRKLPVAVHLANE